MIGPSRIAGLAAGATVLAAMLISAPATASTPASRANAGRLVVDDAVTGQIYTLTPSGAGITQITHVPAGQLALGPRWSPHGRRIVFVIVANGLDRIYTMAADGTHLSQVRNDSPAWNDDAPDYYPGGNRIVFARCHTDGSGCALAAVGVDGTGLRTLTSPRFEVYDFNPTVSADGRRIAFVRFNANGIHSQVWIMNRDGTGAHPVTAAALEATFPAWAPDSTHLTVSSNCCRLGGDIYRVRASGGRPTRLTHTPWPNFSGIGVYAPNGRRIAFVSNRNYPDRSGTDLFLMRANGTHQVKVNIGLIQVRSLDWATDSPTAS